MPSLSQICARCVLSSSPKSPYKLPPLAVVSFPPQNQNSQWAPTTSLFPKMPRSHSLVTRSSIYQKLPPCQATYFPCPGQGTHVKAPSSTILLPEEPHTKIQRPSSNFHILLLCIIATALQTVDSHNCTYFVNVLNLRTQLEEIVGYKCEYLNSMTPFWFTHQCTSWASGRTDGIGEQEKERLVCLWLSNLRLCENYHAEIQNW